MKWSEIRRNSEKDVRAWLDGRKAITGETFGMLALLFDSDGPETVRATVDDLGVRVYGAGYV